MKNPNGYGCVRKLSGKRRAPWAVLVTTGWTSDGKQLRKYLGYYRTRQEAVKALADYNDNPYDLSGITFSELYKKWSEKKYAQIGKSNIRGYVAAYNKCAALYAKEIRSITFNDLQNCIEGHSPALQNKIKTLFSQMYDYAEKRSLVSRNFTRLLEVERGEKSKIHRRFEDDEIEALWRHADDEYIQVILMMIYSGVRPGELLDIDSKNVHIDEGYFEILEGKNENAIRKVPIYYRTEPFFQQWKAKGTKKLITTNGKPLHFKTCHAKYTGFYFDKPLEKYGLLYKDGRKHLPDDPRHTFASLWTAKKLSEVYRRKIQGHSGKGVGEQVYTHITIEELKQELNCL